MSEEYFRMATMQFTDGMNKAAGKAASTDPGRWTMFVGLVHLADGLGILSSRIERLHQKIDRIEKKVGSVR